MSVSRNEINLREARAKIGYLVERAQHAGEVTIITRHGRPAAAIAPIDRIKEQNMATTQNPTWTARLNVIDGVITVAPNEGDEAHYLPERDGLHIDRITLGPWAEDEEDMGRADAALAAEGLARVGDWEDEGDGYVCAVRAADESPIS